jgi:hypothetical protein
MKTKMNQTKKDQIVELSQKWYEYVSQDHHKDRDCHWYVEMDFAYGNEPIFRACHYGYIAHDLKVKPDRKTYEEAENDLLELIKSAIEGEREWVKSALENKKEYDKVQIESAKKFIELFGEIK